MTLQGEDLFLEALPEPYETEALELVRAQVADVDLFVAVSEYYARFMRDYLRIPGSEDARRAARREHQRPDDPSVPGSRLPVPRIRSRSATSRASRRRKACTISPRPIASCAPSRGCRRHGWSPPAICAPEHKPYLEGIAEGLRVAGLGDEFVYRGAVDRAKKVQFFHDIDVLSVPSGYHEPKGLYLLEAMACGVPVVQPNHGAFPEIIARTGGGVLAQSERGADVADAIYELWKDPARAAALGRARRRGRAPPLHRASTWPHGVLKAYQDAQR